MSVKHNNQTMNEKHTNLNAALSAAQAEFKAVAFDATNPFLKNRFASLGACIESTRPILAKHGLSVTQQPVGAGASIGVITTLRHSSGESASSEISLPLGDEKGKSQAQVAGSIITYLRRYSLSGVLGLYADEDNDGHGVQPEPVKPLASAPKPAPAAAKISAPAKVFTPEDRVRFIEKLLVAIRPISPVELQEFCEEAGIVIPTESADTDWPLHRMPATKRDFDALVSSIKQFVNNGDNIP
jgi:hypothetical protein